MGPRPLPAGDRAHGGGTEPALVLAVGARKEKGSARYPVAEVAVRRGAGVEEATADAGAAYARFGAAQRGPAPELP